MSPSCGWLGSYACAFTARHPAHCELTQSAGAAGGRCRSLALGAGRCALQGARAQHSSEEHRGAANALESSALVAPWHSWRQQVMRRGRHWNRLSSPVLTLAGEHALHCAQHRGLGRGLLIAVVQLVHRLQGSGQSAPQLTSLSPPLSASESCFPSINHMAAAAAAPELSQGAQGGIRAARPGRTACLSSLLSNYSFTAMLSPELPGQAGRQQEEAPARPPASPPADQSASTPLAAALSLAAAAPAAAAGLVPWQA